MGMLINMDNGGTLTDICVIDGAQVYHTKTLTTPYDLSRCFIEGLKKASKVIYGEEKLTHLLRETSYIRYSTTQGTNALVERKGPRIGVVVLRGSHDDALDGGLLGKGLSASLVGDRIAYLDHGLEGDSYEKEVVRVVNELTASGASRLVVAMEGKDWILEERRFRRAFLSKFHRHKLGAVPALFSYEVGDDPDFSRRLWSAIFNSFLHPSMERFLFNAEHLLRAQRFTTPLLIFRNDGDSARVAKTKAIKTYSSGPQGGVEGTRAFANHYGIDRVVSMDIGGTTTDVGIVDRGRIKTQRRGEIEGQSVSFELSDIVSYGVGGSSIIKVENNAIKVGPESVGALPGPASFGQGGNEVTMTDVLLVMGVLDPRTYFGGDLRLDLERAVAVIEKNICTPLGISREQALLKVESAWAKAVADALRDYADLSDPLTLLAFGGAGTMEISAIANHANIDRVAIPKHAAVFSAFGIGFSDIAHQYEMTLKVATDDALNRCQSEMLEQARRDMFAEGFALDECQLHQTLALEKADGELILVEDPSPSLPKDAGTYASIYARLRVVKPITHAEFAPDRVNTESCEAISKGFRRILGDGGWEDIPVFDLSDQKGGARGTGPAILDDPYFTCRILSGWSFSITESGDIFLNKNVEGAGA